MICHRFGLAQAAHRQLCTLVAAAHRLWQATRPGVGMLPALACPVVCGCQCLGACSRPTVGHHNCRTASRNNSATACADEGRDRQPANSPSLTSVIVQGSIVGCRTLWRHVVGGHGRRRDITLEEVQQHKTADDAWMVLHGKVCFSPCHCINTLRRERYGAWSRTQHRNCTAIAQQEVLAFALPFVL